MNEENNAFYQSKQPDISKRNAIKSSLYFALTVVTFSSEPIAKKMISVGTDALLAYGRRLVRSPSSIIEKYAVEKNLPEHLSIPESDLKKLIHSYPFDFFVETGVFIEEARNSSGIQYRVDHEKLKVLKDVLEEI